MEILSYVTSASLLFGDEQGGGGGGGGWVSHDIIGEFGMPGRLQLTISSKPYHII